MIFNFTIVDVREEGGSQVDFFFRVTTVLSMMNDVRACAHNEERFSETFSASYRVQTDRGAGIIILNLAPTTHPPPYPSQRSAARKKKEKRVPIFLRRSRQFELYFAIYCNRVPAASCLYFKGSNTGYHFDSIRWMRGYESDDRSEESAPSLYQY
jgi:hypothetical protein